MSHYYTTDYENLVYGEDNDGPLRKVLERVLNEAKEDGVRLQIEVRTRPDGIPNSRQEHRFTATPGEVTPDGLMRVLVDRLNESPGEQFSGKIRLNFSKAGASGERYCSFQRTVHAVPPATGMGTYGRGAPAPRTQGRPQPELGEDGEPLDNDPKELEEYDTGGMGAFGGGYGPPMGSMAGAGLAPVDHQMAKMWLEMWATFTFRALAQNNAMFERATRMMESMTTRFGVPHPTERGITEHRGGDSSNSPQGGLGMLPMLLNAAANLANAGSPAEVAEKAAGMATGQTPPQGAAREAAIRGAAKLVRGSRGGGHGGGHGGGGGRGGGGGGGYGPPHHHPVPPDGPGPRHPGGGGAGGASPAEDPYDYTEYDDHGGHFDPEDDGTPPGEGDMVPWEGDGDDFDPEPAGPPDLTGLSAEEMKRTVIEWIRADPARKGEVMGMIPDLTKEIQ